MGLWFRRDATRSHLLDQGSKHYLLFTGLLGLLMVALEFLLGSDYLIGKLVLKFEFLLQIVEVERYEG